MASECMQLTIVTYYRKAVDYVIKKDNPLQFFNPF